MARKRFINNRVLQVGGVIISLLILLFGRSLIFSSIQFLQVPLTASGTWIADKVFFFRDANEISASELERLRNGFEKLAVDQTELKLLQIENEQLRRELDFSDRSSHRTIGADIINRSSVNQSTIVTLNQGRNQGVRIGMPVIAGDSLLVGKIVDVRDSYSTVKIITDQSSAIAVSLLNNTRTIGIAEGISGNLLALSFIPIDELVEVNDIVVTSGLESEVPAGLLIGVINTVEQDLNAPFQTAVVQPLADIKRYSHVLILLPEQL